MHNQDGTELISRKLEIGVGSLALNYLTATTYYKDIISAI